MQLSQDELATRSGLERSTVQRVERGIRVRMGSFEQVCAGLDADVEEIKNMDRDLGPRDRQACAFHFPDQAMWYSYQDRRPRIPHDNEERIQDPLERTRLGANGFVARFRSYLHFVMLNGPGVFFVEVHGEYRDSVETGEGGVYKDWIMYCLHGRVRLKTPAFERELPEGSAMGFRSGFEFSIAPTGGGDSSPPAVLMFIGANRRSSRTLPP